MERAYVEKEEDRGRLQRSVSVYRPRGRLRTGEHDGTEKPQQAYSLILEHRDVYKRQPHPCMPPSNNAATLTLPTVKLITITKNTVSTMHVHFVTGDTFVSLCTPSTTVVSQNKFKLRHNNYVLITAPT